MLSINEFLKNSKVRFSKTKLGFLLSISDRVILKFDNSVFYREIYQIKFDLINLSELLY
jgi:hypothetical protein